MFEEIEKALNREQYNQDVAFDSGDIDGALERHVPLYVHYAGIAIKARYALDTVKHQLEIVEAILYKEKRAELLEGNPKVTEAQIKAEVTIDSRHRKAVKNVADATLLYKTAESFQIGFDQRKDTLMQLARNLAKENTPGSLRVMANQDARQRLLDSMQRNASAG